MNVPISKGVSSALPRVRHFENRRGEGPVDEVACGRVNPDIFEFDDVAISCPVSYQTINPYDGTTCRPRANRANFPPLSWREMVSRDCKDF